MDRTPEQLILIPVADMNATGIKGSIPLTESLVVTEVGILDDQGSADIGTGAILKVQALYHDNSTATDVLTVTTTASSVRGTYTRRACEIICDKLANTVKANGSAVSLTSAKTVTGLLFNVTTGGAANSKGTICVKVKKSGTSATATAGEVVVTS